LILVARSAFELWSSPDARDQSPAVVALTQAACDAAPCMHHFGGLWQRGLGRAVYRVVFLANNFGFGCKNASLPNPTRANTASQA
jgi:hypothetical protein